jgi:fatty acid desaturase
VAVCRLPLPAKMGKAIEVPNPQDAATNLPSKRDKEAPAEWRMRAASALNLRHHEDLRTMGIVGTTFALFFTRWALRHTPLHYAVSFVWWWSLAIFAWFCATIVHNCVHVPQFKERWQNNLWQLVLTLSYGFPVSTLIPGHNLSHHKHTQGPKDVIRTTKMRWSYNLLNAAFFIPTVLPAIQTQDGQYLYQQAVKGRPIIFQVLREVSTFVIVNLLLCLWDWKSYIVIVLLPQLFAKVGIISINLPQHDGCPTPQEDKYNFSRNFTGPILNFFTCNNGYHTIHHWYPGMHWSVLKTEHERQIAPHMHPALDQPDMLWYLFYTYLLPGGRVMYDGSPYKMPPPAKDEPWYSQDMTETYSDEKAT